MTHYSIFEPLYGASIEVFIGYKSTQDVEDYFRRKYKDRWTEVEMKECWAGYTFDFTVDKLTYYVIALNKKRDFWTLTHEVLHLALRIMRDRGVKLDYNNQEPLAYFVDFLNKKIWGLVLKSKKRAK
jgi:hypothetical protein